MQSTPKTYSMTRAVANTPTLTTATACSRALTGVGATMAPGSQWWSGMMPFLAKPRMQQAYRTVTSPRCRSAGRIPLCTFAAKSRLPVRV